MDTDEHGWKRRAGFSPICGVAQATGLCRAATSRPEWGVTKLFRSRRFIVASSPVPSGW
jgi:hypothetical protein